MQITATQNLQEIGNILPYKEILLKKVYCHYSKKQETQ